MLNKKAKVVAALMAVIMSFQITAGASSNKSTKNKDDYLFHLVAQKALDDLQEDKLKWAEYEKRGAQLDLEFEYAIAEDECDERMKRASYLAEQELNRSLEKRNKRRLLKVGIMCGGIFFAIGTFIGATIDRLSISHELKADK